MSNAPVPAAAIGLPPINLTALRREIADMVERLIAFLDATEPDCDLEDDELEEQHDAEGEDASV